MRSGLAYPGSDDGDGDGEAAGDARAAAVAAAAAAAAGIDARDLWNSSADVFQATLLHFDGCFNVSFMTNGSAEAGTGAEAEPETVGLVATAELFRKIKLAGAAILVLFCVVSVVCNVCVLAASRWIKRRPLTTIMRISLSLTAADSISSLLLGIGLFFNTLIVYLKDPAGVEAAMAAVDATVAPTQWPCTVALSMAPTSPPPDSNPYGCFNLVLEALRLGAVLVTMLHLLALAAVHYLGTVSPLCRYRYVSGTQVFAGLALVWVFPQAMIFAAFAWHADDGFRSPLCSYKFLTQSQFHLSFSLAFFLVLVAMIVIYLHIYVVVHRAQRARQRFQRTGSAHFHSDRPAGMYRAANGATNRQSVRGGRLEEATYTADSQRQPLRYARSQRGCNATPAPGGSPQRSNKNRKAIITTLYILGSYLVGWMPAVVSFMLICTNCLVPHTSLHPFTLFGIAWVVNFLIVLKTMCNAFIYTARMRDIKVSVLYSSARYLGQNWDPSPANVFFTCPKRESTSGQPSFSPSNQYSSLASGHTIAEDKPQFEGKKLTLPRLQTDYSIDICSISMVCVGHQYANL